MSTGASAGVSVRMVAGAGGRTNQLLTLPDRAPASSEDILVFCGGDVQDLEAEMVKHRDNCRHVAWSLERTALLLAQAPGLREENLFETSECCRRVRGATWWWCGPPAWSAPPSAATTTSWRAIARAVPTPSRRGPAPWPTSSSCWQLFRLVIYNLEIQMWMGLILLFLKLQVPSSKPVTLMGFSKGVVVLNQVVRELDNKRPVQLNLATMVWLDGGHNGGRDIWLTDARLLRTLVEADTKVVVRVTPYQVKNSNRPWVGREEKVFTSSLAKMGADISRQLYFDDQPPSIDNHFRIIGTLLSNPL